MPKKILLVDDEQSARIPWVERFQNLGYSVAEASDKLSCEQALQKEKPDLIILDWMMPATYHGEAILRMIRQHRTFQEVPVVIYSGVADLEETKIIALASHVTHFVPKNGTPIILQRMVETLINKHQSHHFFQADPTRREAVIDGERIELGRKEFRLWEMLVRCVNEVVTDLEILEDVYDKDPTQDDLSSGPNKIEQLVVRLRKKVEPDPTQPVYIINRRGMGYVLREPEV